MSYHDYYLRCLESDRSQLLSLGVTVGALRGHEGTHYAVAGDFVEIGPVERPTGETVLIEGIELPVREPVCDEEGNLYWHANLRTELDLWESPLNEYFLRDEDGEFKVPNNPAVVWASAA